MFAAESTTTKGRGSTEGSGSEEKLLNSMNKHENRLKLLYHNKLKTFSLIVIQTALVFLSKIFSKVLTHLKNL